MFKDFLLDSEGKFGCEGFDITLATGCFEAKCKIHIKEDGFKGKFDGDFLKAKIKGDVGLDMNLLKKV